ncbi:SIR2 family NAD-dependent protein deacylase [Pseudomonas sp. NPDC088444]|uniref:SIR2 family NAD-dependent protein deacylase n=1 Tax=Pseudomonas sp. NPDC088444 TaxID=3364456 RepID=UPI00384C6EF4
MPDSIEIAAALLGRAKRVVIFTGAGISAESGIPTYRDPMQGLWSHYDPETLETARAFRDDAALVWGWYVWRRAKFGLAEPNPAHFAVAELAKHCDVTVVTQNIDDLHERSGSTEVVHLHGSLNVAKCFACEREAVTESLSFQSVNEAQRIEPPRCRRCNGKLRPGIVWFGENLPMRAWNKAKTAAKECDVLLSIGTSGVVFPAAEIPKIALRSGASVIHINPVEVAPLQAKEIAVIGNAAKSLPDIIDLMRRSLDYS